MDLEEAVYLLADVVLGEAVELDVAEELADGVALGEAVELRLVLDGQDL